MGMGESRPPKQKAYPQTQTNIKNYRQLLIPARAERASNTPSSDTPRWQQPQPILTPRRRTISRILRSSSQSKSSNICPRTGPSSRIDEDEMKSKTGKERWRKFLMTYEKKVDDYNFGTMLRADAKGEYGEKETIFVPRMQFYAIEIARNRNGLNDWIFEKAQKEAAEAKS